MSGFAISYPTLDIVIEHMLDQATQELRQSESAQTIRKRLSHRAAYRAWVDAAETVWMHRYTSIHNDAAPLDQVPDYHALVRMRV